MPGASSSGAEQNNCATREDREMSETTVERVAVNGVELDVHTAGDPSNPTVVLSHGFPELGYSWRHQMLPLAEAGYHVIAPDQRGYGHSSAPREVEAYGIANLTDDLLALLDHYDKDDAVFVGHDWGAMIVWDLVKLRPERARAVVGVSVPFVHWPAPPTQLMKMMYGDRFFYILYFQPVGPAEAELERDTYETIGKVMWGAGGVAFGGRRRDTTLPPMEGTGFLTMMSAPPARPFSGPNGDWLTESDLRHYADEFAHSGFFGPLSYYRNLDANCQLVKDLGADRVTMPVYFIGGTDDVVNVMDPAGVERMRAALPDFRGATMLEGVGHWTQQEAPEAFNDALLGFLRTL
jgi:pimeloyl-ACP methyl ester carboxylesterase